MARKKETFTTRAAPTPEGGVAAASKARSMTHSLGLPPMPARLEQGVRVLDASGSYAVALCGGGLYLGLFKR